MFDDRGRLALISSFQLSPDGRWLALTSGSTVFLLDMESPTDTFRALRGHEGEVTAAAFGQRGQTLVTAGADKTVRLWRLATAQSAASPLVLPAQQDEIFAPSPDGRWLVTFGKDPASDRSDRIAILWDLKAGDVAARPIFLRGHEGPIFDAAFSPDGRWLATGGHDNTARLWRLDVKRPGSASIALRGHTGVVAHVSFSPDGRWLITGSFDGTVRLWDLAGGKPSASSLVLQAGESVFRVALSADNRWLVAFGQGAPRVWDLGAKDPSAGPLSLTDSDQGVLLSPDGRWLATFGNEEKRALEKRIHRAPEPEQRRALDEQWRGMTAITALWDVTARDPAAARRVLEKAGEPVAFSPDGQWLLSKGTDEIPRLWAVTAAGSAATPVELRGSENLYTAAFSPDSRRLITGTHEGTARVWDLTAKDIAHSSRELPQRYGFDGGITFSADNRWLLGFDSRGAATLWQVEGGELATEPVSLLTQDQRVWDADFTNDGRWLITRSHNANAVSLWPLKLEELIGLACRTAGRNLTKLEWQQYFAGETFRKVCPELD